MPKREIKFAIKKVSDATVELTYMCIKYNPKKNYYLNLSKNEYLPSGKNKKYSIWVLLYQRDLILNKNNLNTYWYI